MKIAVLGSDGQLGTDLRRALSNHELIPFTRSDFDVTDTGKMRKRLLASSPEVIINTTAFHKVDECESRIADAFAVNAIAVFHLANVARELEARLVHFSTDYVFDGTNRTPFTEESRPGPTSVYATSKLAGEYLVLSSAARNIVVRTCGLFGLAGLSGKGGNFVETMLRKAGAGEAVRVVDDQIVTPTPSADLSAQIAVMLEENQAGLFHCTAEGSCSWYEFASAIFELSGIRANLSSTNGVAYKTPARRPAYSVLENRRLNTLGLNRMRDWRSGLKDYLLARDGSPVDAANPGIQERDVHARSRTQ